MAEIVNEANQNQINNQNPLDAQSIPRQIPPPNNDTTPNHWSEILKLRLLENQVCDRSFSLRKCP